MTDSDVGKLFVGGISRDTTDTTLRDYFSKYGDVSSAIIAKDRLTLTPRGFGFVTFSDPSSVDNALRAQHSIAGKAVEVKKAIRRHEHQSNAQQSPQHQPNQRQHYQQQSPVYSNTSRGSVRHYNNANCGASNFDYSFKSKKIFVGGLSANLTEEAFKKYFEQFGRITDVVVMYDSVNNRPRGFGFITFDSEEVVEKLMKESEKMPHELCGKRVEVKKAIPREFTRNSNNGNNSRYGGGRFSPAAAGYSDDNAWPRGPASYVTYPAQYPVSTPYAGCYYGGVYGCAYPVNGMDLFGYGMPVVLPRNGYEVRPFPYGTGYYSTPPGNGEVALVGMYGCNGVVDTGVNDVSGNTQVPDKDAKKNSKNS